MNKIIEKIILGKNPKDEYQEKVYTKNIAKAGILITLIDFLYVTIKVLFYKEISTDIILGLFLLIVFCGYITIQNIMNQIDDFTITSKKELKEIKQKNLKNTLLQSIIFFIVFSGSGYILHDPSSLFTNIIVSISFFIIIYLLNNMNAYKSLKINNKLDD